MNNKWIEMQAISMYVSGFRSALLHTVEGDDIHAFSNSSGYHPVEEPDIWHALRAYQDEQRKKGEPISAKDFYNKCYGDYSLKDISFEFRLGGMSGNGLPYINCFGPYNYPAIACHARFTNFRWRPGRGPKAEARLQQVRDAQKEFTEHGKRLHGQSNQLGKLIEYEHAPPLLECHRPTPDQLEKINQEVDEGLKKMYESLKEREGGSNA